MPDIWPCPSRLATVICPNATFSILILICHLQPWPIIPVFILGQVRPPWPRQNEGQMVQPGEHGQTHKVTNWRTHVTKCIRLSPCFICTVKIHQTGGAGIKGEVGNQRKFSHNVWWSQSSDTTYIKINQNACVSHLPRVDGVQNSPNNFDLNPVTLTYDICSWPTTLTLVTLTLDHLFWNKAENWTGSLTYDLCSSPATLTLVTLTLDHLFWNKAENWIFFTFLTLVTFDLWLWPSDPFEIWCHWLSLKP